MQLLCSSMFMLEHVSYCVIKSDLFSSLRSHIQLRLFLTYFSYVALSGYRFM